MAELVDPVAGSDGYAQESRSLRVARPLVAFRSWPLHQWFISTLIVFYIAKQIVFALIFPAFSGHDEVAHFAYIRTVVEEQRVPSLVREPGPDNVNSYTDRLPVDLYPYCRYTLQWLCLPDDPQWRDNPPYMAVYNRISGQEYEPQGVQYAANHPPLYYMLMAPVYWLSERAGASLETQVYFLRFAVIPFGLLTVLLAFFLVRTLFPDDAFLLITVPAAVALQTQVSYEAAMVNNDIVAIATYSWVLYLSVLAIRDRFAVRICLLLGLALGLGVIAKSTSLTAAVPVAVALLLVFSLRDVRSIITKGLLIAAPAAALMAPWYVHMWNTYGNLTALPQVEELQSWNNPMGTFFDLLFNLQFMINRFHETWGQFGWRFIPLDSTLLWVIGIATAVAVMGLVRYGVLLGSQKRRSEAERDPALRLERWQVSSLIMLAASCVSAYLAVVQFGTEFQLSQARYFFPVINAGTLLLMLGLRSIIPVAFHGVARGAIIIALIVLNTLIITSYVIPFYHL